MRNMTFHEAKTHFTTLIHDVQGGESVVIFKGGAPVAKLVPHEKPAPKRALGYDEGLRYWIAEDFDT